MSLTPVLDADALAPGTAVRVMVADREVCVARTEDGQVHAVDDLCTHGEVSLAEGEVSGCTVECWLHGSAFDLTTGEPTSPPAFEPVEVFECVERDGRILVDVGES
ncbi:MULTISPECIES: non-heme iron oxygenase ferredoxin subunit [Brevibacterium]|uniref:Non-heme iron oxygenase ferredoxin subunit n=1 Tax=Brevibacterium salitolerans TaxID=1403566 RepID=A0ABN2WFT1_9MICO|nr:non-heme iron oxygenase ferredoxin subunit [Brevibacterium sp.]